MSDHPRIEPLQADRRPGEHPADVAAIVRRAGQVGIPAWRVELALGLPPTDSESRAASCGSTRPA